MTPSFIRSVHLFALGLAWVAPAEAQEPTAVMLQTSTCRAEDDAALRRALEVELEALHVEPRWASTNAAGAPAPITLSAECDDDSSSVALRVWSSSPRLVLSRSVALRDVAEPARARTLALVISESLGPTLANGSDTAGERLEPPPTAVEATAVAAPTALSSRARAPRGSGFTRTDPYADAGSSALFVRSDPYGLSRSSRFGAGLQARLALRDSSVLLGMELATSGPVGDNVDWTLEVSYSGTTKSTSEQEISWWNTAFGADLVHVDAIGLAAGPRLSFGYLSIGSKDSFDPSIERTLVTQLGARGEFEVPMGDRLALQMTFGAQHTLGVYALTTQYTGFDEGLNGWLLSWGLGIGIGP